MSGEQMTPEQATLYNEVYVPSFLEKMAELGRTFDNEDDIRTALETTALVKIATASSDQNVIKEANVRLKKLMGVDIQEAHAARETAVKSASDSVSQNPQVRQAILTSVLGN